MAGLSRNRSKSGSNSSSPPTLEEFLATGRLTKPARKRVHDPISAVIIAVAVVAGATATTATAAFVATALLIGGIVLAASGGVGGLQPDVPDPPSFGGFGETSKSPRYSFGELDNTISNEIPLPVIYGTVRYAGNIIWQTDPGETIKQVVTLCEGEIESITDVRFNKKDPAVLSGVSFDVYTGTQTQGVDARVPTTGANAIPSLKFVAYIASTLTASDDLQGRVTTAATITGRKVKTWNGSVWSATEFFSANPAACLRDYLTNRRYGVGLDESFLDDQSFGDTYDQCAALIDDGAVGTHARYQIDLALDARRSHLDHLREMLLTCNGYFVFSAGKIKLRILGLNDTTQHAFTEDNLAKGSLSYRLIPQDERANQIVVKYVDPTQNWVKVETVVSDAIDQAERESLLLENIVENEIQALGITRQQHALRLATLMMNEARHLGIITTWKGGHDAIHLEVGDIVTLTHSTPGWTAKPFRILNIKDEQAGERAFIAREHNATIYDDRVDSSIQLFDYGTPSSPFDTPPDVGNLSVQAVGFLNKDGVYVSNLEVTWAEPANTEFILGYSIEWSEDGGPFVEQTTTNLGFTKAIVPNAKVDHQYQIRVRSVSTMRVKSVGVLSTTITVSGKTAPPLDVNGFDARQLGDEVILEWNANPDVDLWGYEIREGGTDWDSAGVVDTTISGTKYSIRNFGEGTKTYRIKAIDTHNNYSLNAASDSLVTTKPTDSNILFRYDLFHRSLNTGVFSADAEPSPSRDFNTGYYRNAISVKTAKTLENNTDTWEQLESTLNWDTEERVLTEESYTSEAVDVGSVQTAIVSIPHKEFLPDGAVSVEWAFSETDPDPSVFQTFSEGVYTLRYFKVRLKAKTNSAANPARIYDTSIVIDVKDIIDRGSDVAVAAAGTTINFNKAFSTTPTVGITTLDNPYIPYITAKSAASFTVKLRDASDGLDKAGTVDWIAKGF